MAFNSKFTLAVPTFLTKSTFLSFEVTTEAFYVKETMKIVHFVELADEYAYVYPLMYKFFEIQTLVRTLVVPTFLTIRPTFLSE